MAIFDGGRNLDLIRDRPLRAWLYDAATLIAAAACCAALLILGILVISP